MQIKISNLEEENKKQREEITVLKEKIMNIEKLVEGQKNGKKKLKKKIGKK
jgi:wobble nucleotide-excising tRNase